MNNEEEKKVNTEELEKKEEKAKKEHPKKDNKKCLEKLQNELKEKDEKILRLSAEFQNLKRRTDEERMKLLKYDGEKFITSILPVLDNFEHAIVMDDTDLTDEVSKFLSGFKMIYGNLLETLKNNEVTEIECLHEPFDEECMHAVLVDSVDDFEDNVVIDVLQKGYKYKDKVIRPAVVKVNQKKADDTNESK